MDVRRTLLAQLYRHLYLDRRVRMIDVLAQRLPIYQSYVECLSKGNATGVSAFPWRALDQLKVLDIVKPKRIVELGSGTSTGLFAAYIRDTEGASLLSLDESAEWAALTQRGLDEVNLAVPDRLKVQAVGRLEKPEGSYYDVTIEADIDLLYVDGPSVARRNGMKLPNQDVLHHLDAGHRPAAIMIDGRLDTVDAIRRHPAAAEYSFTPGMSYLMKRGRPSLADIATVVHYHRHSVFLRR